MGIVWTGFKDDPKIIRILLSGPGVSAEEQVLQLYPTSKSASCADIDTVAAAIKGLLEGDDIEIPLNAADLDRCSAFQKSVLRAEYRVPRGSVTTYRLIAAYVGKHSGARAVGNALANNPFPLIVPCHRAVRSDRRLGGYQGGIEMKRALLEMEGTLFDDAGRVACGRFYYETAMPDIGTHPTH